jgi:uncharacterized membrane protein
VLLIWFFKGYFFSPKLYVTFKKGVTVEEAKADLKSMDKKMRYSCNETESKDRIVVCGVKIYTNPIQYQTIRNKIESSPDIIEVGFLNEVMEKGPEGEGF